MSERFVNPDAAVPAENKKPANPSAFPKYCNVDKNQWPPMQPGMTLRDYFAGKVNSTLISKIDLKEAGMDGKLKDLFKLNAQLSYESADAMLKEREKSQTEKSLCPHCAGSGDGTPSMHGIPRDCSYCNGTGNETN
jgi:hypothetical protein